MAQATTTITAPSATPEPHYALSEERKFRLHLMSRALDGLASLAAPEETDLGRDVANVTREDLGAIFSLLRLHLDENAGELEYVPASSAAPTPITVTLQ